MIKIKNILITKANKEFIDELDIPLSKLFNFLLEEAQNENENENINSLKRRFYNDRTREKI